MIRFLPLLAALTLCAPASAAVAWAGADATTGGLGVHAGAALLPIPFLGTVGIEGSAERPWRVTATSASRVALGLTLRDLNIPLSRVDAFATLGGQALLPSSGGSTTYALYGEAGLRGPVFGPAGWRAFVRGESTGNFGAGLGLELRF